MSIVSLAEFGSFTEHFTPVKLRGVYKKAVMQGLKVCTTKLLDVTGCKKTVLKHTRNEIHWITFVHSLYTDGNIWLGLLLLWLVFAPV